MKDIEKLKKIASVINFAQESKSRKRLNGEEFVKSAEKIKETFSYEDLHRQGGHCQS